MLLRNILIAALSLLFLWNGVMPYCADASCNRSCDKHPQLYAQLPPGLDFVEVLEQTSESVEDSRADVADIVFILISSSIALANLALVPAFLLSLHKRIIRSRYLLFSQLVI